MMEPWLERWQEGRIGWHEASGNAGLQRFWNASNRRVLVPLCGKSVDLLWLESQGNEVTGVELSPLAARAFFEENKIDYEFAGDGRYRAVDRAISIACADYFEFSGETFDACYDRGALVALPPNLRPRYVEHTRSLLSPGAYLLLIALEYAQEQADGPPFSVDAAEVLNYWPALERIDVREDIENSPPKFREAGLEQMFEVVWRRE